MTGRQRARSAGAMTMDIGADIRARRMAYRLSRKGGALPPGGAEKAHEVVSAMGFRGKGVPTEESARGTQGARLMIVALPGTRVMRRNAIPTVRCRVH
ncbi:hypothetical protein NDU88_007396 [Pleurodeles waltl]|uniref:Uncharacterized protein n=1 Tax=Pleurodeles waltl TaxID=8319 RepID=A0AAV7QKR5_PLEWA|nr:hypothetical protein NDU88_007396 [Pleurodeles waltl]